ncbi:unnamed protein product [Caenorhabditis brenneri]
MLTDVFKFQPTPSAGHARAPMSVGVSLLLIIVILCRDSHQLWCLDGSDCEASDTCALCNGAACLRVQRNHPSKGVTVALTCIPPDSLIHTYHPEGCRTELSSGDKLCLCSGREFCNTSSRKMSFIFSLVSSILFLHFL